MSDAIFPWWATAALLSLLFLALLPLAIADRRRLDGDNVWAKPIKFSASLAMHFSTLALVAELLPEAVQQSALLSITIWAAIGATAFEMGYIIFRAARAEASHFNVGTPLSAALYRLMAIGAVVITLAAAIVGGALALTGGSGSVGPATLWGSAIGLLSGAVLTLVTAFPIGASLSRHVGESLAPDRKMPLTGWSLSVADRRIPHFLGTHAMQVLPVAGVVSDLVLPAWLAPIAVVGVSVAYIAVVFYSLNAVSRGLPFGTWVKFGPAPAER